MSLIGSLKTPGTSWDLFVPQDVTPVESGATTVLSSITALVAFSPTSLKIAFTAGTLLAAFYRNLRTPKEASLEEIIDTDEPPALADHNITNLNQFIQDNIQDDQTYTEARLKDPFFANSSPSPGLFGTVSSLKNLAIASFKIIYSFIKPTAAPQRELAIQALRDFHGIIYGVTVLLKTLLLVGVSVITLSVATPLIFGAGTAFLIFEMIHDSTALLKQFFLLEQLELPLYRDLQKLKTCDTHRRALRTVRSLIKKIERNQNELNTLVDRNLLTNILEKLKTTRATLERSLGREALFQNTLDAVINDEVFSYEKYLLDKKLTFIKKNYTTISPSQVREIKAKAIKLELDSVSGQDLKDKIRELIRAVHRKNKYELSNVTRPWIAEILIKHEKSFTEGLKSTDLDTQQKATSIGLKIIDRMRDVARVKKNATIICMISHVFLFIGFFASLIGAGSLSTVGSAASMGISFGKYFYSTGYLDSVDGSFEGTKQLRKDIDKTIHWIQKKIFRMNIPSLVEETPLVQKAEVYFGLLEQPANAPLPEAVAPPPVPVAPIVPVPPVVPA